MDERLRRTGRFFSDLASSIIKHDIASLSAQICFYAIFSLFPLFILIIYATTLVIPHVKIASLLISAVKPYYPDITGPDITGASDFVSSYIEKLSTVGAQVSLVSFVTLMWSATSAFIAVQQAMDRIFEIDQQRSFVARRVVGFVMLILLIIVAIFSSVALALYPHVTEHVAWWPLLAHWVPLLAGVTRVLYPLSLFITCFIFYRFLPSRRVDVNSVLIGALTATVGLDLARAGFVLYAGHLVSYHLIYGSLTVVMLLVLWMYIAGIILLFGAEISAALNRMGELSQSI
ncbi:YihY/virulence factor BrkB family protein [Alicyclobacillus dauci]|uniref:YihY/virulence factor BrkB family protein n=1 Tax=Alicyclobacillus dauci TaxID=1475485 RepID=A0ABY6YZV1_9BACL|nr:YihY/virulence factor BrkB family protein [Alicyclobacillus dauci]WAH35848.1 YihY/virulence factor BrkB family protein [Alicyclobacillus dauci]